MEWRLGSLPASGLMFYSVSHHFGVLWVLITFGSLCILLILVNLSRKWGCSLKYVAELDLSMPFFIFHVYLYNSIFFSNFCLCFLPIDFMFLFKHTVNINSFLDTVCFLWLQILWLQCWFVQLVKIFRWHIIRVWNH